MKPAQTVLVTGASGFIGTALVERLAKSGAIVYTLSRSGRHGSLAQGDVRPLPLPSPVTPLSLGALLGPIPLDRVYHLASYGVSPADDDPHLLFEGNIGVTVSLLHALAGKGIDRFIYTGSCSEYAPGQPGLLMAETAPLGVGSLYGAAKAAAGIFGATLAMRLTIPFFHLRLFGVYGPGEGPMRLIPYLIDKLDNGKPVDLTPGAQERDFTYIDDLVEALLLAGEASMSTGIYNVCSSHPISVRAIGATVAHTLGAPTDLLLWGKRKYRPTDHPWIVGNNRSFVDATGWSPCIGLNEGVRRMIELYRHQK